ncbi:hypothetical protein ScPMuIL_010002 [Solemya velum]
MSHDYSRHYCSTDDPPIFKCGSIYQKRRHQKQGQPDSLKKVHNWYQANKHTLYSTPRFGKDQQKLKAREAMKAIFRTTSPSTSRTRSSSRRTKSAIPGNRTLEDPKYDSYPQEDFIGEDSLLLDGIHFNGHDIQNNDISSTRVHVDLLETPQFITEQDDSFADGPEGELQHLDASLDEVDGESRATISVHIKNSSGEQSPLHSPNYIESVVSEGRDRVASRSADRSPTNMEKTGQRRKISRPQTSSKSIRTALQEQSVNVPIGLPKRMVHSIPSLVNPHAQLTALEVRAAEQQEELSNAGSRLSYGRPPEACQSLIFSTLFTQVNHTQFQNGDIPVIRPVTVAGTRADSLQSWKGFAKDMSYGQDILGKLDFVGRSGTALDVRYTAHDHGEMPERHTNQVLNHYFYGTETESDVDENVLNMPNNIMKQSLEDFYQTTDGIYPAKLPRNRPQSVWSSKTPKEERVTKDDRQNSVRTPRIKPLGKQLLEQIEQQNKETEERPETRGPDICLDTVVNMIDTVTDDMSFFREKLAPTPQPGFRQPSSIGVSTRIPSRPPTSQSPRPNSPVQRSNTPSHENTRPVSNPFTSRDITLSGKDGMLGHSSKSPIPSLDLVQAVDWRGKIAPDTIRYKWAKTKFGGHTYVKKLMNRPSMRSAGTGSRAGKRPKTAPVSARERWNTNKLSDQNVRVVQAANNNMMQVDQKSVDSMMVIQHVLGSSDSRMGSLGSLYLDLEYLKASQFHHRPLPPTNTTPEYVTDMCTSAPMSVAGSRAQSRLSKYSERPESRVSFAPDLLSDKKNLEEQLPLETNGVTTKAQIDEVVTGEITCHLPPVEKSQTQSSDISLSRASLTDPVDILDNLEENNVACQTIEESSEAEEHGIVIKDTSQTAEEIESERISEKLEEPVKETSLQEVEDFKYKLDSSDKQNILIRITSVSSNGQGKQKPQSKSSSVSQILTKSEVWQYFPNGETEVQTDQSKESIFSLANQNDSSLHLNGKTAVKPAPYCFDSALQSMSAKVGRSAGKMPGGTDNVQDQVLKTAKKQSEFFQKVAPVRTPPSIPSPHHALGGRSPRHWQTYSSELEQQARKMTNSRNFMNKINELRKDGSHSAPVTSSRQETGLASTLQVCHLPIPKRSLTAPMFQFEDEEYTTQSRMETVLTTEEMSEQDEENVTSPRRVTFKSPDDYDQLKSTAYIGRPIAQICQVPDPDNEAAAAGVLREAKAAVDIQRIFRGYVARNIYKKLLKEERERLEDEREAAVRIQRCYRGHLTRRTNIYKRAPVKSETLKWARDYHSNLVQKAAERQEKMDDIAKKNTLNHRKASVKLSVIGPHVNIYEIYHPKQTGPTRRELVNAAIIVQKYARGFLVRRRFQKLKKKAVWYGSNWNNMVKDYKRTLIRVQKWHGKEKVSSPFSLEEMHVYMDLRRRYESVFDKRAFGGELEMMDLEQYLHECDCYPSRLEIEEAIDIVFRGKPLKKRGPHKQEVIDLIFYIYVPKATGLTNTRQSTWMNPIINGVEARKLMGSEYVEDAPLKVCAKLVIDSKRERREKEQQEMMRRLEEEERLQEIEELRQKKERRASKAKQLEEIQKKRLEKLKNTPQT